MAPKVCIICRTEKDNYNAEHIIPKSIGGAYVVRNVCIDCNTKLGKTVDIPFVNHQLIATYRIIHNLSRDGRRIKDPLKGEKLKVGNDEYLLRLQKDGTIKLELIPQFPSIEEIRPGQPITIRIDSKRKDQAEAYISKLAKKYGMEPSKIKYEDYIREELPPSTHKITIEDNPILFGFIKIAYGMAASQIPHYLEDQLAIRWAAMLDKGELDYTMSKYINPPPLLHIDIHVAISQNIKSNHDKHVVLISRYPGVGLVAFIKIFELTHILVLSEDTQKYNLNYLIGINDFKTRTFGIYSPLKEETANIQLNVDDDLHDKLQSGTLKPHKVGEDVQVFDKSGKLIFESLFDISTTTIIPKIISGNLWESLEITYAINSKLFIKTDPINYLIPIQTAKLNWSTKKVF